MPLLTACASSNQQPIVQTIKPVQSQYPDPVGVVLRDITWIDNGPMVCLSADDYLDWSDNTADITLWIQQKTIQTNAYKSQVSDNNAASVVAE